MRNGRPKCAVSPFSSSGPAVDAAARKPLVPSRMEGEPRKPSRAEQGGQEPRRGRLAAVQVLGHGGLAVQRFPEPGRLGPGQAQGHGHGGRVEAQDAPRRRGRAEGAAGAGRVPVGVVADAGGPGDPDHHVVPRHQGREQLPAGGAVLLGHGQGRGDDHDTGVERGVLWTSSISSTPTRPHCTGRRRRPRRRATRPTRVAGPWPEIRRTARCVMAAVGEVDPHRALPIQSSRQALACSTTGRGRSSKASAATRRARASRGGGRTHLTAAPFPSGEGSRRRSGRPPPG